MPPRHVRSEQTDTNRLYRAFFEDPARLLDEPAADAAPETEDGDRP